MRVVWRRTFSASKATRAQRETIRKGMVSRVAPALRAASDHETPVKTGLLRASRSVRVESKGGRISVIIRWSMFYAKYVVDHQDRRTGSNFAQRSVDAVVPLVRRVIIDAFKGR